MGLIGKQKANNIYVFLGQNKRVTHKKVPETVFFSKNYYDSKKITDPNWRSVRDCTKKSKNTVKKIYEDRKDRKADKIYFYLLFNRRQKKTSATANNRVMH